MKKLTGRVVATAIVGSLVLSSAALAHTSPEYFVDPGASSAQIGHRHHITQASVRNTGSTYQIGVGARNDSNQLVNEAYPFLDYNEVEARNYGAINWLRGYSYTWAYQSYRAQEQF